MSIIRHRDRGKKIKTRGKGRSSEVVFREGKPRAVIMDIEEYQDMLERLEDLEDLEMLERMRKESLSFRSLDEFLKEYFPSPC
jgi:PHD/YefM family antitoxin component YafN of YafNO toxin-antitoxin module